MEYYQKEYNEAIHMMHMFKLEQNLFKIRNKVAKLRRQVVSIENVKEKIGEHIKLADLCELNEVYYYNRLEDLCFYILHFTINSESKHLFIKIEKKYYDIFNKIWNEEKKVFKEKDFYKKYPYIIEFFKY